MQTEKFFRTFPLPCFCLAARPLSAKSLLKWEITEKSHLFEGYYQLIQPHKENAKIYRIFPLSCFLADR
jgi:hypothetical protein